MSRPAWLRQFAGVSADYAFQVEADRNLIRMRLGGFFTPADVQGFQQALRVAHRQLRCPPNGHVTIADLREIKIQPQESVGAFQQVLGDPRFRSSSLVFVIGRTLARTQLLRALAGRGARCFDTVEEAEAYLFSPTMDEPLRASA